MKKQIIRNVSSHYAVKALGALLGFFLVPFLIAKLGKDAFGLIVIAESFIFLIEVSSNSLRSALSRHATFTLAQGKPKEFAEYLSTGRCLLLALAALVLVLGLGASWEAERIFRIPAGYAAQSRFLFAAITVSFAITIPNIVYWTILYAKQRVDLINSAASVGLFLRAALIFAAFSFLPAGYVNLVTYGVIYLVMTWAQNTVVYLQSRKLAPDVQVSVREARFSLVREISSYGIFSTISNLSSVVYDNAIQIVVNRMWGPAANALYGVSRKFPSLMMRFFNEPTWSLTPTFTNLAAKGQSAKIEELFLTYSKLVAIAALPAGAVMMALARPIIRMWVGEEFDLAADLMAIQIAPLLLTVPAAATACINSAYARVKIPSFVTAGSTAIRLALGFYLAKGLGWGITGLVAGSSVVSAALIPIFYIPYTCKTSGLKSRSYWMRAYFPPLAWTAALAGAASWVMPRPAAEHLMDPVFWGLALLFSAVYLAGSFAFILNGRERAHLNEIFRTAGRQPFAGAASS